MNNVSTSSDSQTGALPFMPPLEAKDLQEAVDNVAKRLVELDGKSFAAMFKMVSGYFEMPPRQRLSVLRLEIQRFANEQMAAGYLVMDPALSYFQVLSSIDAVTAGKMTKDYMNLVRDYGSAPAVVA